MNQSRMERERYLSRVVRQCMKELDSIQVPYGHVVEVTVNTRARKRWGLCRKEADGYHISIADRLLDGNTEQGLRDTVMHELLHTCPMCNNHGAMWKHFAEVVNRETDGFQRGQGTSAGRYRVPGASSVSLRRLRADYPQDARL